MKPHILLSANTNKEYYIDAINNCGGVACAKYCPTFSNEYDGLVLCGGNDIGPHYYGEDINGAVDIDDKRDEAEFKLAKAFIAAGKPILGICRGSQLLNIVFGGSLYQHIACAEMHKAHQEGDRIHSVKAVGSHTVSKLYGTDFFVNSAHHQAVKKLGNELEVTLMSDDIIEGFEHNKLPIIGVQWHPERMCFSQARNDTVDGAKLFEHFIKMCSIKPEV